MTNTHSLKLLHKIFLACFSLFFLSLNSWAAESITYYHADMYGSPVMTTNESGATIRKAEYRPFGERYSNSTLADGDTLSFTGYSEDDDSGLSYAQARWYNPEIGRFISIDPVGVNPANVYLFNRYAYANNNPYRYVDPDGRVPLDTIWDGISILYDVAKMGFGYALDNPRLIQEGSVDLAADTVAFFTPYVPAGSTKFGRMFGNVTKSVNDFKYAPRVRARGVEDPKSHNFPYSFDKEILKTTPDVKSSGYQIFRKEGTMTGKTVTDPITGVRTQQYKEGVFEIGVRKDGVIDHRFFRPND